MTLDEYLVKNSDNLNIEFLCEKFNVSVPTVYRHMKMNGVKVKKEKNFKRMEEMKKLRNDGKTYQEIADVYGMSRQRVEQIVHDYN